ncbi:MAG: GTP-binding protein [Candidatus Hodarchaeota archaeon]
MKYPPEIENGGTEYKLLLDPDIDSERKEKLLTQLIYRINEGKGEAIYVIGVADDGDLIGIPPDQLEPTITLLEELVEKIPGRMRILRKFEGDKGIIIEVLIRYQIKSENLPISYRVAVIGNVDAGKSTFIAALLSGEKDDGNGLLRQRMFRHRHEIETGRTSSVSMAVLGFNNSKVVNYGFPIFIERTNPEILSLSEKIVRFVDLAGHEKYLKTTMFGMTGLAPDYACLIIAVNMGIRPMTREHLGMALCLKVPIFIVFTKSDICPPEIFEQTKQQLKTILKAPGISKIPFIVKNEDDAIVAARHVIRGRIVPIFNVSNRTGEGIPLVLNFLELLSPLRSWGEFEDPFLLYIDEIFSVRGTGTVISGIIQSGTVRSGDYMLLGPSPDSSFREIRIKSIRYRDVPVSMGRPGQYITCALANVRKDEVRKGQVLCEQPNVAREFNANVIILHHATTIRKGYEAMIHVQTVRQQAKIKKLDKPLRTGDRAEVRFRFKYHPEHLQPGMTFLFREGRTRGMGVIIEPIPIKKLQNQSKPTKKVEKPVSRKNK